MVAPASAVFWGGVALGSWAVLSALGPDDPPKPANPPPRPVNPQGRTSGALFVARLRQYTGKGYTWEMGGTGPYSYDCSGLGWRAANDLGLPLARTASGQLAQAKAFPLTEAQARATPGALCVFFSRKTGLPRHVEYSTGQGSTIASQISGGVKEYSWGWWLQGKQAQLWEVRYYKHPALA